MVIIERFDTNEWFILVSLWLTVGVAFRLPRRFPVALVWLIALFCMTVAITTDHIMGSPPLDMYDINDSGKYSLMDAITWFLYAPFGYLFLHVYDRYRIRGVSVVVYVLFCAALSVLYEYLSSLAGVFRYRSWSLAYSLPVYILTLSSFLVYFHALKRGWMNMTKRRDKTSGAS